MILSTEQAMSHGNVMLQALKKKEI